MTPSGTTATLLVAAVLCLTACGEQTGGSAGGSSGTSAAGAVGGNAEPARVVRLTAGRPTPRLACPNGERSVMIADVVHGAEGARAPQDAVGQGLVAAGERLVVSPHGTRVWVLRADGTARVELVLVHHDGWLVRQRTTCG